MAEWREKKNFMIRWLAKFAEKEIPSQKLIEMTQMVLIKGIIHFIKEFNFNNNCVQFKSFATSQKIIVIQKSKLYDVLEFHEINEAISTFFPVIKIDVHLILNINNKFCLKEFNIIKIR